MKEREMHEAMTMSGAPMRFVVMGLAITLAPGAPFARPSYQRVRRPSAQGIDRD